MGREFPRTASSWIPSGISISSRGGSGSIGFDGTNYLVPWVPGQYHADEGDLNATRVTTGGGVIDPDGFRIGRQAPSEQVGPAVASSGTDFLAVWQDYRAGNSDIYAARVTESGQSLDGTGIPVALGGQQQVNPTVTFDGSNYLVVWEVRQSERAGGPLRRAREPHGHGARPRRLPDLGEDRHPG